MKTTLLSAFAILALAATPVSAHESLTIGPNDGRVFDLSSKTTPHLEVGQKDGKFVIHVLDKDDKPMPLGDRTLAITAGERSAPDKLKVEKSGETFTAPIPEGKKYPVVFQLREKEGAKPINAKMNYDASNCGECNRPEWLCSCGMEDTKKKK